MRIKLILALVLLTLLPMFATAAGPLEKEWGISLNRGMNLGNMLDAPKGVSWGVQLEANFFDLIKSAGFDHVRIPIRWSDYTAKEAPYLIESAFAKKVDWAIKCALDRRLFVIINVHHFDALMKDPNGQRARFIAIWKQLAERYKSYPNAVFFELLNEPCEQMTAVRWNGLFAETLAVVRKTNPTRLVVVGPVQYNNISQLPSLQLPANDQHLLVTVHYYNPFDFTHQGAEWVGKKNKIGVTWQATPEQLAALRKDLDTAAAWAKQNKRPLFIGEYGTFDRAGMNSRAKWTYAVTKEALARKMPVTYWEFCSTFGMYNPEEKCWRPELLNAVLAAEK